MKVYQVVHRCGTKLGLVDESYKSGFYPYCKKCRINVTITPVSVKNTELKFVSASANASADSK
jgi:hypothetical protein